MNIALIYGGSGMSGEHEVSLESASSIVRTIDKKHRLHLIGITKTGEWFLHGEEERERIIKNPKAVLKIKKSGDKRVSVIPGGGTKKGLTAGGEFLPADVVFPVLHGRFGEDGTIQGLFEMAGIPYVGGNVAASSISMDKEKTKIVWEYSGLPVVPYIAVKKKDWFNAEKQKAIIAKTEKDFDYPLFVKPCNTGSSVGVGKVKNRAELLEQAAQSFLWDNKILIETAVDAREVECSVTGNDDITAYTPGEIIPSHNFYDYEAKYTDPDGAELKIPADLDEGQRKNIRELAIKAYEALELTGLSRIDFFIDKKSKKIYLNEINTIPGFTSISMFPKMCAASGLPYERLIMYLLELAIERFKNARSFK